MPVVGQYIAEHDGVGPVCSAQQHSRGLRLHDFLLLELFSLCFCLFATKKTVRSGLSADIVFGLPARVITLLSSHFTKKSLLIKDASVRLHAFYMVLYSFAKVFPLTGFMPFKPGI